MVETTFDIRIGAGDQECVVATNVTGERGQQAELVAFGHYVARVVSLLGPAFAGAVVETLFSPGTAPERHRATAPSDVRAVVRFVDGASGPRIYFRLKARGPSVADSSVAELRRALLELHGDDESFGSRLARCSDLLGRLAATGQIRPENEFDLALAAADVAWGMPSDGSVGELECPACRTAGELEPLLWPSQEAAVWRCGNCGAGVWERAGHRPRLIRADIWSAMESLRTELAGVPASRPREDGAGPRLLLELKRVFAANGWPYSEVDGAPVLVTELSGSEGRWDFYAQVVEDKELVLLYSISPQRVPVERRLDVSEFLTRANYGLADGNFELDFDDGEVRFKTVLHVEGDELDDLLVKRIVRSNGAALETYLPTIGSIIAGGPNNRD
jgi:hypothetical protein